MDAPPPPPPVAAAADGAGLPTWLNWTLIIFLLCLSALFSGLNLGLMGLDKTGLKVLMESGEEHERKHAKKVFPIRNMGNFLLCTLLLGNVAVNTTLSILMADLTSGLVGAVIATGSIVIFGEIVPQAICSKHGLAVGAATVWVVKIFMVLTGPISYPISRLLDLVLGRDLGNFYSKNELKQLMLIHAQAADQPITQAETKILTGVLDFKDKSVSTVMTAIEKVFSISIDDVLDYGTFNKIIQDGHSRIPVYEGKPNNIVSLLVSRHLALLDPEDKTAIRSIVQFYGREPTQLWEDSKLDVAMNALKSGSHMATVMRVMESEDGGDPFYECVGIVTLEDLIEELIQEEIEDEGDVIGDPQTLERGPLAHLFARNRPASVAMEKAQMSAVMGFLRSNVEAFSQMYISDNKLQKMVAGCPVLDIPANEIGPVINGKAQPLYVRGQPNAHFTLVLQGKLQVTSGADGFVSVAGPFAYLGVGALVKEDNAPPFKPDFSVKSLAETQLWRVTRKQYAMAVKATQMERAGAKVPAELEDLAAHGGSGVELGTMHGRTMSVSSAPGVATGPGASGVYAPRSDRLGTKQFVGDNASPPLLTNGPEAVLDFEDDDRTLLAGKVRSDTFAVTR